MTLGKFQILSVGMFPLILTAGILIIPVVSDYSNHLLAEQAVSQTGRWFWGHAISGIAFGLAILAAHSITRYLYMQGQGRFGMVILSLIAVGGALYAFGLGADGIGPLATATCGGRALVFFEGSGIWVVGVFIAASIIFGAGLITQLIGLSHAGLLKGMTRIIVFIAAVIFLVAGAIPSGWALYGVAVTALVVYLLITNALWRQSAGE